jgi:hypothetical protein
MELQLKTCDGVMGAQNGIPSCCAKERPAGSGVAWLVRSMAADLAAARALTGNGGAAVSWAMAQQLSFF